MKTTKYLVSGYGNGDTYEAEFATIEQVDDFLLSQPIGSVDNIQQVVTIRTNCRCCTIDFGGKVRF